MNLLYKQSNNMSSSLLDTLDRYRCFSESTEPVISVICADSTLRQEMEIQFAARNDVVAKVYGSFNDEASKNIYDILLSDVAIVCTRAKTILPLDLRDIVKEISGVKKPVYVFLAGWEAMPRTPEVQGQRIERAKTEFEFADVIGLKNVYSETANGLTSFEEAVQLLCSRFIEGFEKNHADQDEKMYQYVKKHVKDYYDNARYEINEIIIKLNKYESAVIAKQKYYMSKFSFLENRFDELADKIEIEIKDISYEDITDEESGKTLSEIFSEDIAAAQSFAKKYVSGEIQRRITQLNTADNCKSVTAPADSIATECANEMAKICDEVSVLAKKYVNANDIYALKEACENSEELFTLSNRYGDFMSIYIEDTIKHVPARVKAYDYHTNAPKKIMEFIANSIASEESEDLVTKNTEDKIKLIEEANGSSDPESVIQNFRSDVDDMILSAKDAVTVAARERLKTVKMDIEQVCSETVKKYLGTINKELGTISTDLDKALSEYKMG